MVVVVAVVGGVAVFVFVHERGSRVHGASSHGVAGRMVPSPHCLWEARCKTRSRSSAPPFEPLWPGLYTCRGKTSPRDPLECLHTLGGALRDRSINSKWP